MFFVVHLSLHIVLFLVLDLFHHGAVTKTMSTPLDTYRFVFAKSLVLVYSVKSLMNTEKALCQRHFPSRFKSYPTPFVCTSLSELTMKVAPALTQLLRMSSEEESLLSPLLLKEAAEIHSLRPTCELA